MKRIQALFNPTLRLTSRTRTMTTTIASVKRISPETLSGMILGDHPSVAVVDVRDSDHIGGHIKGSHHFPSGSLESTLPTLIRTVEGKNAVVFHCALSQQRGPSAALRYLREMERLGKWTPASLSRPDAGADDDSNGQPEGDNDGGQTVYVLDRGFVGWQETYGEDERLTEGYRKEIWRDGYWM